MFPFPLNTSFRKHHGQYFFTREHQPDPEAVIAGTFCLMSRTMMSGGAIYLPKIIDNLNFLADCTAIDTPLRTLCRRMACHWEAQQLEKCKGLAAMPLQDETQPFVITPVSTNKEASTAPPMTHQAAFAYAIEALGLIRDKASMQ